MIPVLTETEFVDWETHSNLKPREAYTPVTIIRGRNIPAVSDLSNPNAGLWMWFIPEPNPNNEDEKVPTVGVRMVYSHYFPGIEKGFKCSGDPAVIQGNALGIDPDHCLGCAYAFNLQSTLPEKTKNFARPAPLYYFVGFNLSAYPLELEKWQKDGLTIGEKRDEKEFTWSLVVLEARASLTEGLLALHLNPENGAFVKPGQKGNLHQYRVRLLKEITGPLPQNVKYHAYAKNEDLAKPRPFTEAQQRAITALVKDGTPPIAFLTRPEKREKQIEIMSLIDRGSAPDPYADNSFNEAVSPPRRHAKDSGAAGKDPRDAPFV